MNIGFVLRDIYTALRFYVSSFVIRFPEALAIGRFVLTRESFSERRNKTSRLVDRKIQNRTDSKWTFRVDVP